MRILGFPCGQFQQELPTNAEIERFARSTGDAKWDLFAKVDVKGEAAHPLWSWLCAQLPAMGNGGGPIADVGWNFTKFLVSRDGTPLKRYAPNVKTEDIESDIAAALEGQAKL